MPKGLLIGLIAGGIVALATAITFGVTKGVGAYKTAQAEAGAFLRESMGAYGDADYAMAALRPYMSDELVVEMNPMAGRGAAMQTLFADEAGAFEAIDRASCGSFASNTQVGQGKISTAGCIVAMRTANGRIDFDMQLQGRGDGWRVHGLSWNVVPSAASEEASGA